MINSIGGSKSYINSSMSSANPKAHEDSGLKDSLQVSQKASDEKEWSVLLYMNNNNSLCQQGKAKLEYQLKDLEKSDKMNLIVQHSYLTQKGWDHPNAIDANRYVIGNQSAEKVEELGPINMGSPDTLSDFIKWGMKNYPAKKYMVVMQGHGGAWKGAMPDDLSKESIDLPELKKVFDDVKAETNNSPEVVVFDSCLMGNTETAYQLKDSAQYMVGSQELEWGMESPYALDVSAPYKKIFGNLSNKMENGQGVTPEDMAKDWVKSCKNSWTTPTQSAVKLSEVGPLTESIDKLANRLLNSQVPISTIREIANETKDMVYGESDGWDEKNDYKAHLIDLYEFAEKLSTDPRINEPQIKKDAQDVLVKFKNAVVANEAGKDYILDSPLQYGDPIYLEHHHEGDRNHGLSIFAPTNKNIIKNIEEDPTFSVKYKDIDFSKNTAWGKLVEKLYSKNTVWGKLVEKLSST